MSARPKQDRRRSNEVRHWREEGSVLTLCGRPGYDVFLAGGVLGNVTCHRCKASLMKIARNRFRVTMEFESSRTQTDFKKVFAASWADHGTAFPGHLVFMSLETVEEPK